QHQLIELAEAVADVPAIKGDDQLTFVLIDPLYDAKITIVDLAIVIVLDLHDLVARAEGPAKALNARLARRIECFLQLDVQGASTQATAVHRTQHLHIADCVEPEGFRNTIAYDGDDLCDTVLGRFGVDEIEIGQRSVVGQFRHLPAIDPVSIDNHPAAGRLPE